MTNLANDLSLHFYTPVYDLSDYQLSNEQLQYTAMPLDAVHRAAVQEGSHPIVILEKDIPAGFFVLDGDGAKMYSDNKKAILLRAFSVQTTFQGRGIAQRSLKLLPDFVREHFPEKNEIILAVNCRNRRAQYVYQKAGFEDKGIRVMGKKGELIVLHRDLLITKTY